jgi:hypothetical protein
MIALRRARLPPSRSGLLLRQRGGHGDGFIPDAAFWGAVAQAVPTFADRPNAPGFLPELTDVVCGLLRARRGGGYTQLLARQGCLADELKWAWGRLRVHAGVALQAGVRWLSRGGGGDGGGRVRAQVPACPHH